MFKNIMIPATSSKASKNASKIAIDLAEKLNSEITAIHVIDSESTDSLINLEDKGLAIIEEIEEEGKKRGIKVNEHLIYGKPVDDMETILIKAGGDLVVISQNDNLENIFGEVTKTVLKNSPVPVLLIK